MKYLHLIWRNLMRKKARTLLTLLMVTVALSVAPIEMSASPEVMLSRVTVTVSLSSRRLSSSTLTSMVAVVLPAAIVTEPDRAV